MYSTVIVPPYTFKTTNSYQANPDNNHIMSHFLIDEYFVVGVLLLDSDLNDWQISFFFDTRLPLEIHMEAPYTFQNNSDWFCAMPIYSGGWSNSKTIYENIFRQPLFRVVTVTNLTNFDFLYTICQNITALDANPFYKRI